MKLFRFIFLSLCLFVAGQQIFAAEPVAVSVNINTADADSLSQLLTGVGEAKARAIIAYRESYGPFQSVDELVEVKGIGESLLNKNRARITLE